MWLTPVSFVHGVRKVILAIQRGEVHTPESIVRIGRVEVNIVCLRSQMFELKGGETQFWNGTNVGAPEAVNYVSDMVGHFFSVYTSLCDGLISI